MAGMQCLQNESLLFTNWLVNNQFGEVPHGFERAREKKVVWIYSDFSILKTMLSIRLPDLNCA
jgi:hypothetical protein